MTIFDYSISCNDFIDFPTQRGLIVCLTNFPRTLVAADEKFQAQKFLGLSYTGQVAPTLTDK
jgi:hypothetical protein